MDLSGFGKILLGLGVLLFIIGAIFAFADRVPGLGWLGRLPGDIVVKRENFSFYFPLATSVLVSIVLSLLMWFLSRR